jgi:hypothetical protein
MLHKLKLRAESFDNWVSTVKNALDVTAPKKLGKNVLIFFYYYYVLKFVNVAE